jgi:penicillin-binding protein 1C
MGLGAWVRTRPAAAATALGAALLLAPSATAIAIGLAVGSPEAALDPLSVASTRLLARDGSLLREVLSREDGRAIWVPLERISPHLLRATLVAEDRRFFRHGGVDPLALARAATVDLLRGRVVSGASTISMQLARLLSPPGPRTLRAKVREAAIAVRLEALLGKRGIFWQYLNRAPYGNGAFGVEAGSRLYFGKPASQLSLAEAAMLAALPRSPSGYNPLRTGRAALLERQRRILRTLEARGLVTAEARALAERERLDFAPARRPFRAPHFTQQVLAATSRLGATAITTTLDSPLQEVVEAAVERVTRRLRDHGVTNAAVLVVDNATSEVLAYVGSADFSSERDHGQVDGTLARRQPGSTMKPFTYALALEQGLTAATLLEDLPVHFSTDEGDYAPRNYDDTFHGPVRLRVALGSSYNVPAVRTGELVGVPRLLDRLHAIGFRSLTGNARHYGLGLTLGDGEVTLQELVAAYAALARGGRYLPLVLVRGARSPGGAAIALPAPSSRRVFDARVAWLVSDILADKLARLPAFGAQTPLDLGFEASVKTGTSKDFRDNWTVGFTREVTVGVWAGNFDGSSMHNVSGITGAGPLWAEVALAATRDPARARSRPSGIVTRDICPLSGKLVGASCDGRLEERFIAGTEPREPCDLHREVVIDRRNGLLAGPGCPPAETARATGVLYPPAYRSWASARGLETLPTEHSPLCPDRTQRMSVRIRFPVSGDRYFVDPDLRRSYQKLPLEATVEGYAPEVAWLVDGSVIARAPYPYGTRWTIQKGRHTIEAVLQGGQHSSPVVVTVE